jgi:hypothetical protein
LYRFDNEPRAWETCIFEDNGNSDVVARYATESEAIAGHNSYVFAMLQERNTQLA